MIKIVCTGDSHTWGQGAKGAVECLGPKVVAGDLRPTAFYTGGYVNVLRRAVEERTGSHSVSLAGAALPEAFGGELAGDSLRLPDKAKDFVFDGELVRLHLTALGEPSAVSVFIDKKSTELTLGAYEGDRPQRVFHLHCPAGAHTLRLVPGGSAPLLCSAEFYGGSCAVINAGVGSTTATNYLAEYFDSRVRAARPDVILAEAHTVNDWLSGIAPDAYAADLRRYLSACRSLCGKVALLTVIPVGGKQVWTDGGGEFTALAAASRRLALEDGVPLADANIRLSGLSLAELVTEWLDDNWHPNDRGHALYASELFGLLVNHGWI